ncbi:unnamed protein product, partial [Mesorhabditis spiculigera]
MKTSKTKKPRTTTILPTSTTTTEITSDYFTIDTTELSSKDYATDIPHPFYGVSGDIYQAITYEDLDLYVASKYDPLVCKKGPGDQQFGDPSQLADYKWDGTPFHTYHHADATNIAISMFVLGFIGAALATVSGLLVLKNPKITRIVSIGMIADAGCRIVNSLARFYYGKCVFE